LWITKNQNAKKDHIMTISVGDTLPDATLLRVGAEGPEGVELSSLTKGRKVVIFGLPGAYTGVCSTAHVPSFMRTKDDFAAKGVEDIICVAVNLSLIHISEPTRPY